MAMTKSHPNEPGALNCSKTINMTAQTVYIVWPSRDREHTCTGSSAWNIAWTVQSETLLDV